MSDTANSLCQMQITHCVFNTGLWTEHLGQVQRREETCKTFLFWNECVTAQISNHQEVMDFTLVARWYFCT